ncbi:hypothetical protein NM688_g4656 [Phlebia brevispora]|uniref:Uncharacterized protein n=1 Tax=Phlebia brevispora TaxID=194682 RepID=A0ACC1T2H7_9APHY|nr:hypothetical protein NM688_g4656 [Phlebia brevispora]
MDFSPTGLAGLDLATWRPLLLAGWLQGTDALMIETHHDSLAAFRNTASSPRRGAGFPATLIFELSSTAYCPPYTYTRARNIRQTTYRIWGDPAPAQAIRAQKSGQTALPTRDRKSAIHDRHVHDQVSPRAKAVGDPDRACCDIRRSWIIFLVHTWLHPRVSELAGRRAFSGSSGCPYSRLPTSMRRSSSARPASS